MSNFSISQLKQAISIKEEIAKLEAKLAAIFGGGKFAGTKSAKAPKARGVFKRSAATIARMKASQQARWAKIKGTATPVKVAKPAAPVAKKKGTMSPEGRAKLAAAMKARWAARKKGAAALDVKKK